LGKTEQSILIVTFVFKGTTLNKKCASIMIRSGFLKRASSSGTGINKKGGGSSPSKNVTTKWDVLRL